MIRILLLLVLVLSCCTKPTKKAPSADIYQNRMIAGNCERCPDCCISTADIGVDVGKD